MKRSFIFAAGVVGVALFVWAGCAQVIDLGDESNFRLADSSVSLPDVNVPEQDAAEAGSELTCGLARVKNEACRICIETKCCAENLACANDQACIDGVDCIQTCSADSECIGACPFTNAALNTVVECSQRACENCAPGPFCQHLGQCARYLPQDTEGNLLRSVVKNVVLLLDEAKCTDQRHQIAAKANNPACDD